MDIWIWDTFSYEKLIMRGTFRYETFRYGTDVGVGYLDMGYLGMGQI